MNRISRPDRAARPRPPLLLLAAALLAGACTPPPPIPEPDLRDALLLDVRSPAEFAVRRIAGAKSVPYDRVAREIAAIEPDRNRPIIVYCEAGVRAWSAQKSLRKLGYREVRNGVNIPQMAKRGFAVEEGPPREGRAAE